MAHGSPLHGDWFPNPMGLLLGAFGLPTLPMSHSLLPHPGTGPFPASHGLPTPSGRCAALPRPVPLSLHPVFIPWRVAYYPVAVANWGLFRFVRLTRVAPFPPPSLSLVPRPWPNPPGCLAAPSHPSSRVYTPTDRQRGPTGSSSIQRPFRAPSRGRSPPSHAPLSRAVSLAVLVTLGRRVALATCPFLSRLLVVLRGVVRVGSPPPFFFALFFFFYPRILVLLKTGTGISVCGKPESEIFFFFFYLRFLVLWKTGTGKFSFCGKPESENFFFFLFFHPRILVFWKRRIPILWKTGTGQFLFCGKPESENSLFLQNKNRRILVLWKTRLREFSFCGKREFRNLSKRGFLFCGKREFENSRFVENENWRNLVLSKTRIRRFSFSGERESENSRFVENETLRILLLWKTRIREFPFCGKSE